MKISIFDEKVIAPLEKFGLGHPFFGIHINTLIFTWLGMLILFSLVLIARIYMKKNLNVASLMFEKSVEALDSLCKESFGQEFKSEYFYFVSTIFFFTLSGCLMGLVPFCKESTEDLNTTFAIGSLCFFYVQYQKIKVHGVWEYLKEFTQPFFLLLPLNIIGELAKIASMSFRLFGNILGGAIIFLILKNALEPLRSYFIIFALSTLIIYWLIQKIPAIQKCKAISITLKALLIAVFFLAGTQIFFGVFEGFVQSFVITMLTITYLAVGVQHDNIENIHKKIDAAQQNNTQIEGAK
jgi:F-type H+-transporting ATPase subunit a